MNVRVCRECGEEYRPEIAVCAECGGALEDRYDDGEAGYAPRKAAPRREAEPEPQGPDLSGQRSVYHARHHEDIVPLAERLRAAAIAFHLVQEPPDAHGRSAYELFVREGDAAAALRLLAPLLAHEDTDVERLHAIETEFEAGVGYWRCPACETPLASGARECAECGLSLGLEPTPCASCGEPRDPDGGPCPSCGAEG